MFDLISIGDCILDQYFKISDAHLDCSLDKQNCQLCINYKDKLPVDEYYQMVGGNAINNSVGAQRLELKSAIYTNIGSDPSGQKIKLKIKQERVDARYLTVNEGMESNTAAVISFQGERTILVYHQPWEYNLPDLDRTKWVYFSSLAYSFTQSNIVSQIENYVERTGCRLGFNPGTFQLKEGIKKYPKLLSLMNIIFVNLQEAQTILEFKKQEKVDIKKLLKGLYELGPRMVVITNGGEGSYGFEGENYYKLASFPAKLVEMTGAGDSFATGVIGGLFYNHNLAESMRWGAINSASVIEHVGPQEGLLTYDQIQKKLKENSKFIPKKF